MICRTCPINTVAATSRLGSLIMLIACVLGFSMSPLITNPTSSWPRRTRSFMISSDQFSFVVSVKSALLSISSAKAILAGASLVRAMETRRSSDPPDALENIAANIANMKPGRIKANTKAPLSRQSLSHMILKTAEIIGMSLFVQCGA